MPYNSPVNQAIAGLGQTIGQAGDRWSKERYAGAQLGMERERLGADISKQQHDFARQAVLDKRAEDVWARQQGLHKMEDTPVIWTKHLGETSKDPSNILNEFDLFTKRYPAVFGGKFDPESGMIMVNGKPVTNRMVKFFSEQLDAATTINVDPYTRLQGLKFEGKLTPEQQQQLDTIQADLPGYYANRRTAVMEAGQGLKATGVKASGFDKALTRIDEKYKLYYEQREKDKEWAFKKEELLLKYVQALKDAGGLNPGQITLAGKEYGTVLDTIKDYRSGDIDAKTGLSTTDKGSITKADYDNALSRKTVIESQIAGDTGANRLLTQFIKGKLGIKEPEPIPPPKKISLNKLFTDRKASKDTAAFDAGIADMARTGEIDSSIYNRYAQHLQAYGQKGKLTRPKQEAQFNPTPTIPRPKGAPPGVGGEGPGIDPLLKAVSPPIEAAIKAIVRPQRPTVSRAPRPQFAPRQPQAIEPQELRLDGSRKGKGFLGELKRPDGGVSTELSIGVSFDGREMEIPSLVPTLTDAEINHLLGGNKPTQAIIQKAVEHARKRLQEGKSVFAEDSESRYHPLMGLGNPQPRQSAPAMGAIPGNPFGGGRITQPTPVPQPVSFGSAAPPQYAMPTPAPEPPMVDYESSAAPMNVPPPQTLPGRVVQPKQGGQVRQYMPQQPPVSRPMPTKQILSPIQKVASQLAEQFKTVADTMSLEEAWQTVFRDYGRVIADEFMRFVEGR